MTDLVKPTARGSGIALAIFVGLCAVVAGIGGAATASSVRSWYPGLHKPPFNPPDWVFGPVWTALYLLMAVAAWRVWRRGGPGRPAALALWGVQLALNLAWSLIFFGLRAPGPALVCLALLLAAVAATTVAFARNDRAAGVLLLPYLGWCAFAFLLNFEIWRLN